MSDWRQSPCTPSSLCGRCTNLVYTFHLTSYHTGLLLKIGLKCMLCFKMHQNHHLILHLLCWSVSSDINTSRQLITWEPLQQDKDSFNTGVSQVSTVSTAMRGELGSSCVYLNGSHIHWDHSFCCFQDLLFGKARWVWTRMPSWGSCRRRFGEKERRWRGCRGRWTRGWRGRRRPSRAREVEEQYLKGRREANTPDLISHLVMMFCASTKTFK